MLLILCRVGFKALMSKFICIAIFSIVICTCNHFTIGYHADSISDRNITGCVYRTNNVHCWLYCSWVDIESLGTQVDV